MIVGLLFASFLAVTFADIGITDLDPVNFGKIVGGRLGVLVRRLRMCVRACACVRARSCCFLIFGPCSFCFSLWRVWKKRACRLSCSPRQNEQSIYAFCQQVAYVEYSWKLPENYKEVALAFENNKDVLVAKFDVSVFAMR